MNLLMLELLAIAILASLVCVIPGVFLVLRGVSLMSDAISHALLLGIVLMFLLVRSLTSPLLLVGAAIAGFAVVIFTEYAIQQFKLHKDAAIGLFFPFFFSTAVILISLYTRDAHLDTDMVLLGDMVFAPFSRLTLWGVDCGPHAIALLALLLVASGALVWRIHTPLVMSIFDPLLARSLHVSAQKLYYGMMFLTSIIAVAVFSVVGSVIVVALMIVPAAAAYCTARSAKQMLVHASLMSICAAVGGYLYAAYADLSIAGSIAVATGIIFMMVVLVAPRTGIVGKGLHYGTVWLMQSLTLIEKHHTEKIVDVITLQQQYGWNKIWGCCVVWYGVYKGRIKGVKKGFYVG